MKTPQERIQTLYDVQQFNCDSCGNRNDCVLIQAQEAGESEVVLGDYKILNIPAVIARCLQVRKDHVRKGYVDDYSLDSDLALEVRTNEVRTFGRLPIMVVAIEE